jgi:nucleotide-binding universal stress UspA family protein
VTGSPVLCCTDGSDLSIDALRSGLRLLGTDLDPVVVTVVKPIDWGVIHGTGFAGGITDDVGYDAATEELRLEAEAALTAAAERLGLADGERCLVWGDAGLEICRLAAERGAAAIIIGTRGNGGLRRAFLGSVSDHVVRNAPCPVIVIGPPQD